MFLYHIRRAKYCNTSVFSSPSIDCEVVVKLRVMSFWGRVVTDAEKNKYQPKFVTLTTSWGHVLAILLGRECYTLWYLFMNCGTLYISKLLFCLFSVYIRCKKMWKVATFMDIKIKTDNTGKEKTNRCWNIKQVIEILL